MRNGTLAQWRRKANTSNAEIEECIWIFYLPLAATFKLTLRDRYLKPLKAWNIEGIVSAEYALYILQYRHCQIRVWSHQHPIT